jgi:hypothetical protein
MFFFLAFHFSISLTPNCRNWSPNYSVLVLLNKASRKVRSGQVSLDKRVGVSSFFGRKGGGSSLNFDPAQPMGASKRRQRKALDTSSSFPASGRLQRNALNTSSSFPFQNKAASFAAKGEEEEEEEEKRTEACSSGSSTGRRGARSRSGSTIEAGSKGSKGSSEDSTAGAMAGRLDKYGNGTLWKNRRAADRRRRTLGRE